MRTRLLTIAVLVAIAAAVAWSLRSEGRFSVENPRIEQVPGGAGARVAGTLHNGGARAERVAIEITVVGSGPGPAEKDTITLDGVEAGADVPFASRPHPGEIRTYSIHVDEGRNPYGN